MQKLYEIMIPGLSMTADFPAVHHRLLADFPDVVDVLAMTTPATVLVVYKGEPEVEGWIDALSDSVATRRIRLGPGHVAVRQPRPPRRHALVPPAIRADTSPLTALLPACAVSPPE